MTVTGESVAIVLVATGGAGLLGVALFRHRAGLWNAVQRKGLVYAGGGFLMSAAAARWLQDTGTRGIAISLMGTLFAMRGMYLLLRERANQRAAEKPRFPE